MSCQKPVLHVLLGKKASGKTRWVLSQEKVECCGFDVVQMRQLLSSTALGRIAITSTRAPDLNADAQTTSEKARDVVERALGGQGELEFEVSVLTFP